MPIYEYKCTACEHEFEAIQKMSDQPLLECPSCQAESLVKKVSAAAFRLKGGGWYETDFKSGSKKNLAGEKEKAKDSTAKAPEATKADKGAAAKDTPKATPPAKSEISTKGSGKDKPGN